MSEFDEIQLERSAEPPPAPRPKWIPIVTAGVLLLGVAALWYYFGFDRRPEDRVDVDRQQVAVQAPGPAAGASDLPPLDQTDALVRELLRALSSHPVIASWLTTDQLIRNFTVSVANVAEGDTPARHLRPIAPGGPFRARLEGEVEYVDDSTYRRFDGHAAAVAEMDPQRVAELYRRLKPRLDEAYRELAGPSADFDRTLQRAIVHLLETPLTEGPIALKPSVVGYDYADPTLQSLSRAQQQLVRMGPQNARRVQQTLRAIALELGVPDASLPRRD